MSKPNWAVGLDGAEVEDLGDTLEDLANGTAEPNPESTQSDPQENPFDKMTIHDMMVKMRRTFIEDLLGRLEDGTATHQELAIIQRMLNDSGYVVDRDPTSPGPHGAPSGGTAQPQLGLPDLDGHDYD